MDRRVHRDINYNFLRSIKKDIEDAKWYSKIWKFAKNHPEIFTFLSGLIIAFGMFWLNWFQNEVIKHYFTLHNIPEYYVSESKFEFHKLIFDIGKTILLIIIGFAYIFIDYFSFQKRASKEDKCFDTGWYLTIVILIIYPIFVYYNQISLLIMCMTIIIIVLIGIQVVLYIKGRDNLFLLKILILFIIKIVYISVAVVILLGALVEINTISLFFELMNDRLNFVKIVLYMFVMLEVVIIGKKIIDKAPQKTVKFREIDNKKGNNWFSRKIESYIFAIILLIVPIVFIQIPNPFMFPVESRKDSYNFFRIENKSYISIYKNESNIFAKEIKSLECEAIDQSQCNFEFKDNKLKIFDESSKEIEYQYTNKQFSREEMKSKYQSFR